MIERLALKPIASDDTSRNWADKVENHIGLELQDEYTAPNYSALPAPPSPAPWYPPPPPTSKYKPPRTHYTPPWTWYNPSRTRCTSRHPPFYPNPHLPPMQRVPFKNRTRHVTVTRWSNNSNNWRTHHPIRTLQPETQSARTVRTGARLAPTDPPHSGAHHHLPNHHLPLP